jgi:hypothetical protein
VTVHYLSNGTEGDIWTGAWCNQCVGDHGMHPPRQPPGAGCPIFLDMLMGEPNDALTTYDQRDLGDVVASVHCSAFRPCAGCEVAQDYHPLAAREVPW